MKKVLAKDYKIFDDKTMEIGIEFSPFEHGHKLGTPRNYNPEKYQKMVENKETQTHIANGYALGTFTHDFRDINGNLKSMDNNGKPVIPICKTLEMTFNKKDKIVYHKQRVTNNPLGLEVQTLIKNGIGGFSSAHNLNTGKFYGFDYVHYPNFTTNRVIVDNACKNGMCSFDEIQILKQDLEKQALVYLDTLGIDRDNKVVLDAIVNLELTTNEVRNDIILAKEIKQLKAKTLQFDNVYDTFKTQIDEKYNKLIEQIKGYGFEVDTINAEITKSDLDLYFKKVDFDAVTKLQDDMIAKLDLKKFK